MRSSIIHLWRRRWLLSFIVCLGLVATILAQPLQAPEIVKIKDLSPDRFTVVWKADPAVHRYEVFIKGRGWEPAARRNRHHVTGLASCSKTNVRVRAVDAEGNVGAHSRKKTVYTLSAVPAPGNLSAMALGDTVYLEWDAAPGADSYRITTERRGHKSNMRWQEVGYTDMLEHSAPDEMLTWHVMEDMNGEYRFTVASVDYNCHKYNQSRVKATLGWH